MNILFKEKVQKYKNAHCEVTKYKSTMLELNNSYLSSLLLLDSLKKFYSLCNMWSNQASCDTGAPCEVNLVDIASAVTFNNFLSLILKLFIDVFIDKFSLVFFDNGQNWCYSFQNRNDSDMIHQILQHSYHQWKLINTLNWQCLSINGDEDKNSLWSNIFCLFILCASLKSPTVKNIVSNYFFDIIIYFPWSLPNGRFMLKLPVGCKGQNGYKFWKMMHISERLSFMETVNSALWNTLWFWNYCL